MPLHLDGKSKPGPLSIDWQRVALAHETRVAELEAALRPLAEACLAEMGDGRETDEPDDGSVFAGEPDGHGITFGMIRRAMAALANSKV